MFDFKKYITMFKLYDMWSITGEKPSLSLNLSVQC